MDRESISTYGLTIVSMLVLFALLFSAISITKDTKATVDVEVSTALAMANEFDATSYNKDNYCTVTVLYITDEGYVLPEEQYIVNVKIGDKYYVNSPVFENFSCDDEALSGMVMSDTVLTVHYTPISN